MKPTIITEEKRSSRRGGFTVGSIRNRYEARQRAELLRPVFAELAGMPARAIARELTARGVRLPGWGPWHAMTVIRVQRRLKGK
jgi:hypothetical protein